MTRSSFDAALNEVFRGEGLPELQLIACSPLPSFPGAPREAFRLTFQGPVAPVLPQRIYTLENANLGKMDIFLVPLGPDSDGMKYEAVFN